MGSLFDLFNITIQWGFGSYHRDSCGCMLIGKKNNIYYLVLSRIGPGRAVLAIPFSDRASSGYRLYWRSAACCRCVLRQISFEALRYISFSLNDSSLYVSNRVRSF